MASEPEKCGLCDGLGIVADPHHGHSMNCPRCGGKEQQHSDHRYRRAGVSIDRDATIERLRELIGQVIDHVEIGDVNDNVRWERWLRYAEAVLKETGDG